MNALAPKRPDIFEDDPHFRAGPFLLLVLLLGPPIGLVVTDMFFSLFGPRYYRFFELLQRGESWFFAYWVGGIFAIASSILFVFIAEQFGRHGLGTALFAAAAAPIAFRTYQLLADVFGSASRTKLFNLNGTAGLTALCLVTMTICWFLARTLRFIR